MHPSHRFLPVNYSPRSNARMQNMQHAVTVLRRVQRKYLSTEIFGPVVECDRGVHTPASNPALAAALEIPSVYLILILEAVLTKIFVIITRGVNQ